MDLPPEPVAVGQVTSAGLILLPIRLVLDRPWRIGPVPLSSIGAMDGRLLQWASG